MFFVGKPPPAAKASGSAFCRRSCFLLKRKRLSCGSFFSTSRGNNKRDNNVSLRFRHNKGRCRCRYFRNFRNKGKQHSDIEILCRRLFQDCDTFRRRQKTNP